MIIELHMEDENGVKAVLIVEAQGWTALTTDVESVKTAKRFEPVKYNEIVIFRDDGSIYRHGFFHMLGDTG